MDSGLIYLLYDMTTLTVSLLNIWYTEIYQTLKTSTQMAECVFGVHKSLKLDTVFSLRTFLNLGKGQHTLVKGFLAQCQLIL